MGVVETAELAPNEKRCSKCKEVKDRGEFNKNKLTSDGLGCQCKTCVSQYSKSHYIPKPKEILPEGMKRCSKCKAVKGGTNFYRDKRNEGLIAICKICIKQTMQNRYEEFRRELDPNLLRCPECRRYFRALASHLLRTHKVKKEDIKKYSELLFNGKNLNSPAFSSIRSSISSRPKKNLKKSGIIEIKDYGVTFSEEIWVDACNYARIRVAKNEKKVYILPNLKHTDYTRVVSKKENTHRYFLSMPDFLTSSLDVNRDFEFLDRKGFAIKFKDKNDPILHALEIWSKISITPTNLNALSTNPTYVSIAEHIWPENMRYVRISFNKSNKSSFYLDLYPVFSPPNKSKSYHPLRKVGIRLGFSPLSFIKSNNLPMGDWFFQETLPSGALRFRLFKERVAKQLQEAS